jgi:ABC-type glycerol-3-phosphate transport system substrate-binding protein
MIRGDWLDEIGLDVPETINELVYAAEQFKQKYDIYPITSSPPHTSGFFWLNAIFYAFGGGWDTWIDEEDGDYVMCWVSEGNRDALRAINGMYRQGLIDPEFFANTDTDKMDLFLSSKAAIVFHNGISDYTDRMKAIDPKARIDIFNPPQGPDGLRGQWAMDGFFTAVSIRADIPYAKRKKALDLLDFLYSPEGLQLLRYGVEGEHYDATNYGPAPLLPQQDGIYKRLREIDGTAALRDFVELGDIWIPEWDPNQALITDVVLRGERFGQVPLFLYGKTDTEKEYRKQLTDLAFRYYIQLVQSESFDSDWQEFHEEWNRYGGQEMTAERNPGS